MIGRALVAAQPVYTAVDRLLRTRPQPPTSPVPPRSGEVGVVVQGPVFGGPADAPDQRLTKRCVDSVRRVLPHAHVVLSTYRDARVAGLDVDRVVLSDDPGPTRLREPGTTVLNNVNRQVATTRAGLHSLDRPYALKIRSDLEVTHDGFLRLFRSWPDRSDGVRVLSERIVAPTYYTFNPRRIYSRFPYQVSDWCQFGLLEDLAEVWATPRWDVCFEWLLGRRTVTVEQWIWMSLLNRHDQDAFVGRPDVLTHSELSIVNNVVVVEPDDMGIRFLKFVPEQRHETALMTHGEWQRLYDRHCSGRRRTGVDRQALLRSVVARLWVTGLAPRLTHQPFVYQPPTLPVIPPGGSPLRHDVKGAPA